MKSKLLWVSDNPKFRFLGQSRVTREFCGRLVKEFDVFVAGFNEPPKEHCVDYELPYTIDVISRYDTGGLLEVIRKIQPEVMILSHDIWLFPKLCEIRKEFPKLKIIGYITIDGEPFSRLWRSMADACDLIITPSNYGEKIIKQRYFDIPVEVIPYGVDTSFGKFRPVKDRKASKEILTETGKIFGDVRNKFLAFSIGNSQTRKNWSCARDAWSIFAQDKKDVHYIFIVHSTLSQQGEWVFNGDYDMREFSIVKDLLVLDATLHEEQMLRLIWASDVLLFPSIGEGFGLPILEAMACGVVPIVANFSAPTDFCKPDNSILLDYTELVSQFNVIRAVVDKNEMANKIQLAYNLWKDDMLKIKADKAVTMARTYSWDKSGDRMIELVKKELTLNRELVLCRV